MGRRVYQVAVGVGFIVVLVVGMWTAWHFRPVSHEIVTPIPQHRLIATTSLKHLTIELDGKMLKAAVPTTEYRLATETKTQHRNVTSIELIRYMALVFVLILYGFYSVVVLALWCRYQFFEPASTAKHHAENTRKLDAILGFAAGVVVMLVGNIDMTPQPTVGGALSAPIPAQAIPSRFDPQSPDFDPATPGYDPLPSPANDPRLYQSLPQSRNNP